LSKPSVGNAVIPEQEKKQKIKELTVLKAGSKDSIFSLIIGEDETENGSETGNGQ